MGNDAPEPEIPDDPFSLAIEDSLRTILQELRNGKWTRTVTELYDETYKTLAVRFVQHPDNIDADAICHQIASGGCTVLLAARRLLAITDRAMKAEAELKAIKEIFNLP